MLVLLGADPLADFPDTDLATRAVAGARTVIAVDRFLTASAQQADVVLAASGPAETDGTTTNLEGRISTVARKITPPGTARDDWMLAAELARLLGTDLGVESADQILEEITAVAPSHAGLTVDAIHGARDGVVVGGPAAEVAGGRLRPTPASLPRRGGGGRRRRRPPTPRAEQQAAEAEATEAQADAEPAAGAGRPAGAAGALGSAPSWRSRAPSIDDSPAVDAYSLRLVANRRLYDLGTDAQHSPGLAGAHQRHRAAPAPARLRSPRGRRRQRWSPPPRPRGRCRCPCSPTTASGAGAAVVTLHQPGATVGALIDATARVTEIRVVKP